MRRETALAALVRIFRLSIAQAQRLDRLEDSADVADISAIDIEAGVNLDAGDDAPRVAVCIMRLIRVDRETVALEGPAKPGGEQVG